MFVLDRLVATIAELIDMVLTAYLFIVFARAIISWVNPDPYNGIVRFLYQATEPVFRWVRRRLPLLTGAGMDFTPMVVILAILFVQRFVLPVLVHLVRG
jgi:YggT family protein